MSHRKVSSAFGCARFLLASAAIALLNSSPAMANDTTADGSVVTFTPVVSFEMTVSKGAASCLPKAKADVVVTELGTVEEVDITTSGLPPNTDFVIFIIQVPNAPFGLVWYNGDIPTNAEGVGHQTIRGRFNIGTFIMAPGSTSAPIVFPDNASTNPPTPPVQIYHMGIWFGSPDDAAKAGCPGTQTQFNSNHIGGIQVLNTATFPDDAGPLRFDPAELLKQINR